MSTPSDPSIGLDASVLELASDRIAERLEAGDVPEGRRQFFEGLHALQNGELEAAVRSFRRAVREAETPFDAMARVGRGECERLRGRLGVAIREWRTIAEDDAAPDSARYMAWLSVAAAADDRGDDALLERARSAIEELETSEEA